MTENVVGDVGKIIIDVLIANEHLQFALKFNKSDISDAIYMLYLSTLKLINKIVTPGLRQSRLFRLKYHHILSNESVEEYLFHCLSKILSEVLDEESSYQRFIQPVTDLHMKLMSILSLVQLQHYDVVNANRKVRLEIHKNQNLFNKTPKSDNNPNTDDNGRFVPVYYVPNVQCNSKLRKWQFLTLQAINKHYLTSAVNDEIMAMWLDFDNAFADFELEFVCQVNKSSIISRESAEKTMDVAILFAEAVRWAHQKGLVKYSAIADCDIEIMVDIPRLTVLYGCGVAKNGPLSECLLLRPHNKDKSAMQLAPVFENHAIELARLRRQLNALSGFEMAYLSSLLLNHSDLPGKAICVTSSSCSQLNDRGIDDRINPVSGDVHALFKLISSVADSMQSEHASDYRFLMETVYKLFKDDCDDSPLHSIPFTKTRSTPDLFLENGCMTNAIDVEKAIDALSYLSSSSDMPSICMWRTKTAQSPSFTNSKRHHHDDTAYEIIPRNVDWNVHFNRPVWQHDSSCTKCCHCGIKFSIFRRRHHCRRCGYLFCNSCWGAKFTLPSVGINNHVPVCVECEEFISGTKHLKSRAAVQRTL